MTSRVLIAIRVEATPERAFEAFTAEIAEWWRPHVFFRFAAQATGRLHFEPGVGGRLCLVQPDGRELEVGRVQSWQPPSLLEFSWRQQSFEPGQSTLVRVRFEPVGAETRVIVEHFGWDAAPLCEGEHEFSRELLERRHAEWWQELLSAFAQHAAAA
jgi:uncharacterized protein YndB with AHSA1/START domain